MEEVVDMITEITLDILDMCEIGMIGKEWKAVVETERKNGVAFILKPKFADKVEQINYVNEGIISVTIKLADRYMNCTKEDHKRRKGTFAKTP